MNQVCAIQTGCFSGDAPSYPITIDDSAGRSDRLTRGLTLPDENTDGIRLSTNGISLDLNGFEIARVGCAAATTDCRPASGTGIGISGQTSRGSSVRNGSVMGAGSHGIDLGQHAVIVDVRARWNRPTGIKAGNASTVQRCTSFQHSIGFSLGLGSTISGNSVYQNGSDGIEAGEGCLVEGNTVRANTLYGLRLDADTA